MLYSAYHRTLFTPKNIKKYNLASYRWKKVEIDHSGILAGLVIL